MKYLLPLVAFLAVSCGNPHISSSSSGLERSNPPIESQECDPTIIIEGQKFFITPVGMGDAEEYLRFVDCKKIIREPFTRFSDGERTSVTNSNRQSHSYILTHRAEISHDPEKVETIEDIFGTERYTFVLETPVENNGENGTDRGADSGSATDSSRDAFLWSFNKPITFWSGKFVGLTSAAGNRPVIRLFDCKQELIRGYQVILADAETLSFISRGSEICHVAVSAGGNTEAVAVDGFQYGN